MKNIALDIKNKSFKPIYLLYGDEQYLKASCLKQLKQAIVGDDAMNLSEYSDKLDVKRTCIGCGNTSVFCGQKTYSA